MVRVAVQDAWEQRERVREAALALGFAQVGFAPAEPPAHAAWYQEWLRRGWHGELGYLAREDAVRRRLSPVEALKGCRSLIVVSLRHDAPAHDAVHDPRAPDLRPAPGDPLRPIVAAYAGGRDYHDVFEERLDALADRLAQLAPGSISRRYVDYGPVLERDHAQRAGLGWVGKNTMLIHPRLGSYLLLGELLTTLELPPDEPFTADRCGSCDRCIVACPTDAIRGPRELDARRCISYLTIELRGAIPVELRGAIGTRVFGCDICQEVCPWNRDAEVEDAGGSTVPRGGAHNRAAEALALEPGRPARPESMIAWAQELLGASADDYRARYRGTALARPGRDGMLRNLCVGLGNAGRPEALPVLRRAAADASPLVREHAEWALARFA